MVLGAVAAIGQKNIKRLMAYSSIGHMGYALLGLAAGTALGARGVLIYLAIYVFTNLGVFACIQAMRRGGQPVENIADLAGLARTNPKLALVFAHAVPQPGGPAAAGRLLRQILCLPRRHPGGADMARRHRRARERDRPGLLSAHGEGDVFRRAGGRLSTAAWRWAARRSWCFRAWWRCSSSSRPRRSSPPPTRPPKRCFLDGLAAGLWPASASTKSIPPMRKRAAWPLAGEHGPLWITAARQTAGRGRRGRAWETPAWQSRRHLAAAAGTPRKRMAAAFLCRRHRGRRHGGAFRAPGAHRRQMAQ